MSLVKLPNPNKFLGKIGNAFKKPAKMMSEAPKRLLSRGEKKDTARKLGSRFMGGRI